MPHIPQYLDEPFKVILWPIDECVVFGGPFFILMLGFDAPICGLIIGALLMMGLQRIKGDEGVHALLVLCYWYLPRVIRFKVIPASWQRILLG